MHYQRKKKKKNVEKKTTTLNESILMLELPATET